MVDFSYLYQGLCGLGNAHRAGTMAGHLGAAVVTGYFIGEDHPGLSAEIYRGVEGELQRIMQGEEGIWFDAKKVGLTPRDLFQTFPEEPADGTLVRSIAQALAANGGDLIESGHNTIFASIAIRAITGHSQYATPSLVAGIRQLIEAFNGAYPGKGYFGKERGWLDGNQVTLAHDETLSPYTDLRNLVDVTMGELIAAAPIRRQGFGGLWHVINHAAAITELDRLGYKELAQRGLTAHRRHLRLWRSLPDLSSELGAPIKATHSPFEPVFWQGALQRDQARLTHRIKTIYGFSTLMRHVDDPATQRQAEDALLYLMA